MDIAQAAIRLQSLANDSAKRSKTSVLREVFVDIEAAIRAGVPQVAIIEELRDLGLDINQGAFRSALRRLRTQNCGRPTVRSGASRSTEFAYPPFADAPPAVCTTSSGSIYDPEALCRLIRASDSQRQSTQAALFE
jgi:hypothetical protein